MIGQPFQSKEEIQNQLSSFLKRIKQREEQHHRLCDQINKVLMRQSQLEQTLFIHDEILKMQNRLQQNQVSELNHIEIDKKLAFGCDDCLEQEQQKILGRRIMSRILEVSYAAIQAFREHRQYYSVNYFRFKDKCLKLVNEGSCIPSLAIQLGSKYLSHKMEIQHVRLKEVICCMELTNYQAFSYLKSTYYELLIKKENTITFRKQYSLPVQRQLTPALLTYKGRWKQQETSNKDKESKKDIRVRTKTKTIKEQIKMKHKQKRSDTKKIKKYVTCIGEVMDICKEDFLEDLAPNNKDWQSKRLLGGLLNRNKINQNQIITFLEREPYFEEKTSRPILRINYESNRCHSLQKQIIDKVEDDIQFIPNSLTLKDIRIENSPKKEATTVRRRQSLRIVPFSGTTKLNRPNQRATVNNIEQLSQKKKDKPSFSSYKQIGQAEHIVQINLKGAIKLSKARFPEIPIGRATSVSKKSIQKHEEQPSPLRTKLEIKQNGAFFEQIEKRIVKFCQLKKSLVI